MVERFYDIKEAGGSIPPSPTIEEFLKQMSSLIPVGKTMRSESVRTDNPDGYEAYADEARYSTGHRKGTGYSAGDWYVTEIVIADHHRQRAVQELIEASEVVSEELD